jgi:hypothetical protein
MRNGGLRSQCACIPRLCGLSGLGCGGCRGCDSCGSLPWLFEGLGSGGCRCPSLRGPGGRAVRRCSHRFFALRGGRPGCNRRFFRDWFCNGRLLFRRRHGLSCLLLLRRGRFPSDFSAWNALSRFFATRRFAPPWTTGPGHHQHNPDPAGHERASLHSLKPTGSFKKLNIS